MEWFEITYEWMSCCWLVHVAVEQVFEINDLKAFKTIVISVASYSLGLLMIAKAPWYLLPLAWAWTGTAITGVCSTFPLNLIYNTSEFKLFMQDVYGCEVAVEVGYDWLNRLGLIHACICELPWILRELFPRSTEINSVSPGTSFLS